MFRFNSTYFFCFVALLITEICIAMYVSGGFIRHSLGDFLVVILLYCFIRCFNIKLVTALVITLLFAYMVELLQYFNVVEKLHLQQNRVASTVIGTSFSWGDILAYNLGMVLVIIIEKLAQCISSRSQQKADRRLS